MSDDVAFAGIDWASALHAVCVVDVEGEVLERFEFAHGAAAIGDMIRRLKRAKVSGVAIERGDGPVVEALMDAGVAVFVVPPRQVKALRERYGSAGNKDDRFDAYLLADTLRCDGRRWRPLREDSEVTKALRALCRSRKDLVEVRVGVVNQLRANLELAFPGGIGLFSKPDSAITLCFLRRFPTATKAAWLSPKRMAGWLESVGYNGGIAAAVLHGRLVAAAPGLRGIEGEARGQITLGLVAAVESLNAQIAALEVRIDELFSTHPDQHIFSSLPRSGTVRAASCSLRSVIAESDSPPTAPSLASRVPAPRRASRVSTSGRCSVGRATRNSVLPSWTSPTAAAWPTPGPLTSTNGRSSADAATHMPSASSPVLGCESFGDAGKTASPSTRLATGLFQRARLDIGHSYGLCQPLSRDFRE